MCLIPILQSVSQIKDLYKEEKAEIIMDNTSVVLFLGSGPTAHSTHKWVSDLLDQMTIDTQHDNLTFGNNGHGTLDFNKAGRALMTPSEVKEMPTTDAIVFIKASKPIYDTKAIPFDKKNIHYKAPKWLKERYNEALSYGKYEHPVHTIYDPVHFKYITVEPDMPYQIITDKNEIKTYQEAAKHDSTIYTYTIDESKLLYLSWGTGECSKERISKIYNDIQADEKARKEALKGLIVMQNREDKDTLFEEKTVETNKDGWDKLPTVQSLIKAHWSDLSIPEQEQVSLAFAEDLTEEQIRNVILAEYVKMALLRAIYKKENEERKK